MHLQGLTEKTESVFRVISTYPELDQYYLVGGTALAIRSSFRLSEDLYIFFYNQFPGRKTVLPHLDGILKKLSQDFEKVEYVDSDKKYYAQLIVEDVKVELFSENRFHRSTSFDRIGKIRLPSEGSLLGMKIIALHLRETWRDIYDLYALRQKYDANQFFENYSKIMSSYFCKSKRNREKLFRSILGKLQDLQKVTQIFNKDNLTPLNPSYTIKPNDVIEAFSNF